MRPAKGSDAPSLLAMNPRNPQASASRRRILLRSFDALPEDDRADLLEAVESLASRNTGLDSERLEARRVIHAVYRLAGWDDGRPRS